MKVASYNILSGGFKDYSMESPTPERLLLLKAAFIKIDADILGLIDTFRWTEVFTDEDLKKEFHYPYVYSVPLDDERLKAMGHDNGIAVFSRYPVKKFQTLRLFNRNAISTTVELKGKNVDIVTLYLDDKSEEVRLMQVEELLKKINPRHGTLVMGDLNTFSPLDLLNIIPKIDTFLMTNPLFRDTFGPPIEEMKKGKVIQLLESQGFRDAALSHEGTIIPKIKDMSLGPSFLTLDYAFSKGDLSVTDFIVHKGDIFEEASDHYPISCILT